MKPIGKTIALVTKILVVGVFALAFLELFSRIVHWGKAPLLPYYFEEGAALLPSNANLNVSFLQGVTTRYMTDAWGARMGDPAIANQPLKDGVLVIGDSQVLGYNINFPQTFASQVGLGLTGNPNSARILAAPASHPGTFQSSLHKYAATKIGKQRLMIVSLNLGNDLDELYDEGVNVTHEGDPLGKWFLTHSYVYMDLVLVRSHWLKTGDLPIGINPIFYMLDSQERVILAREAVTVLDRLLNDATLEADQKLLLIIPADIQMDPAEFYRYKQYYSSDSEFEKWNQRVFAAAATMNALEEYITKQMEQRGHRVIRLSAISKGTTGSDELFDNATHHLTGPAHALLSHAILESLH